MYPVVDGCFLHPLLPPFPLTVTAAASTLVVLGASIPDNNSKIVAARYKVVSELF